MNLIRIKTGANISNSLQSTLNYHQAFTELIKNSVQNGAHNIDINVSPDKITVSDDGTGFGHEADDEGLTGFEKFFVYGNSYKSKIGAPQLGHMGIGGKISNDKLSPAGNVHWRIDTKNDTGKSFIFDYKPRKLELHKKYDGNWHVFEEDGTPYTLSTCCHISEALVLTQKDIEDLRYVEGFDQVNDEFCKWDQTVYLNGFTPIVRESTTTEVTGDTGTVITIFNIDGPLKTKITKGWIEELHTSLNLFFGHLVTSYKKQSKPFNITINGQPVIFKYNLQGTSLGRVTKKFQYNLNGEKKTSSVDIQLSIIHKRQIRRASAIKNIEVVSQVRICPLKLTDDTVIEKVLNQISVERGQKISRNSGVMSPFANMVGFVICDDLSSVLDSTGMPAKDISHHSLRDDHPMVPAFKFAVYYEIINIMVDMHIERRRNQKMKKDNNIIAFNIARFISQEFNLGSRLLTTADKLGLGEYFDIDSTTGSITRKPGLPAVLGKYGKGIDPEIEKEVNELETVSGKKRKHKQRLTWIDQTNISPDDLHEDEPLNNHEPIPRKEPRKFKRSKSTGIISDVIDKMRDIFISSDDLDTITTVPKRQKIQKRTRSHKDAIAKFKERLTERNIIVEELKTIEVKLRDSSIDASRKVQLEKERTDLLKRQDELVNDPNAVYLWHSLEPLGTGKEHLASKITPSQGHLCVCINTENPKFKSFDQNNNTLGMALHIAECMIRELIQIEYEGITKEVLDERVSAFYATHFPRIASMNLMDIKDD